MTPYIYKNGGSLQLVSFLFKNCQSYIVSRAGINLVILVVVSSQG